jgi:methyl-accepting chemotaxis protein
VATGSKLVTDAGRNMEDIVRSVKGVSTVVEEITVTSAEQRDGIGEVSVSVAQLERMTQQNAALVEQGAAAAESLREQAARLSGMVRAFRLERENVE